MNIKDVHQRLFIRLHSSVTSILEIFSEMNLGKMQKINVECNGPDSDFTLSRTLAKIIVQILVVQLFVTLW